MRLSGLFLGILLILSSFSVAADWDFSRHSVPVDEIMSGGPPRDGIPGLLDPRFLPAPEANFMKEGEQVLGVAIDGKARAYPTRILSWHELVNDRISGQPLLVSW